MIGVLIADGHELVRSGIKYILDADPKITVVGTAGTGEEALNQAETLHPDIVLIDIHTPGIGGLEACYKLRQHHPEIKIIALSVCDDSPLLHRLLQMGIHGYISKSCSAGEMIKAIKTVHQGHRYFGSGVTNRLILAGTDTPASPFDQLSCREMEVASLTLQGKSIQEIATLLSVSPKTVCTYRYRVFDKLGIKNDVELTRLAAKYNLLNEDGG